MGTAFQKVGYLSQKRSILYMEENLSIFNTSSASINVLEKRDMIENGEKVMVEVNFIIKN
jgi:hypothetical protein